MPDVSAGGSAADPAAGGSPADSALSGRQAISMHTVKRTEIVLLCADFLFRFFFLMFCYSEKTRKKRMTPRACGIIRERRKRGSDTSRLKVLKIYDISDLASDDMRT